MNMFPPNRPRIWVAFDFDGTLAEFHGWGGLITQACPIPLRWPWPSSISTTATMW